MPETTVYGCIGRRFIIAIALVSIHSMYYDFEILYKLIQNMHSIS